MNKRPDDETLQQQREYDKDRREAVEGIYDHLWKWEAYAMTAAETASDYLDLVERPMRDVAICFIRKVT